MSKRGRRIVASAVFVAGVVALVVVLTGVFTPHADAKETWAQYRALSPNSLDVLVVGNSHAFTSFAPMQLWKDARITAWDIGASAINTRMKRAYVEAALETQRPKVLAVELYSLQREQVVGDRENSWAYDYMPFGAAKFAALFDTAAPPRWERHVLPLEQYHQNYATLQAKNVGALLGRGTGPSTGGATPLTKVAAEGGDAAATGGESDALDTTSSAPATATALSATLAKAEADSAAEVRRIADICRARHIRLVLWLSPVESGFIGAQQSFARLQSSLASTYPEIVFMDANTRKAEIGLVASDFRDRGHLFAWGMTKYTAWFQRTVLAPLGVTGPSSTPDTKWWNAQARKWNPPTGPTP